METERAEGFVLRVQPVTETSLLATWFTREHGKLKTLAKGARRPKSPMRGKIDLFYEDEIVFLRSRRSDLHLLNECFLVNPRIGLRRTVEQVTAASFVGELVDVLTEVEDPNPAIYELMGQALDQLEKGMDWVAVIWFELQLMRVAGWQPDLEGNSATDKLLRSLAGANAAAMSRVRLTREQVRAGCERVWGFHEGQMGRTLRTQKLLRSQIDR